MSTITKCIFPAAGFGTRFLPATKSMPKEMLPVVNKPLIHFAVEETVEAGVYDMGIIYGRYKKAIPDYFDGHYELEMAIRHSNKKNYLNNLNTIIDVANFAYIRQKYALGLGHAILTAQPLVNQQPFGVILADDLCLQTATEQPSVLAQMCAMYHQYQPACIIAVEDVPVDQVDRYGIVEGTAINDSLVQITNLTEKPKPADTKSTLAIVGRYILSSVIFTILERLHHTTADTELQLTSALNEMVHSGYSLLAYRFKGKRFDCGNVDGMMQATDFVYRNKLYIQ